MEDVKTPILSLPYGQHYMNTAVWSPGRPAVLYTGMKDGVCDAWDLGYKTTEPVFSIKVKQTTSISITLASLRFRFVNNLSSR